MQQEAAEDNEDHGVLAIYVVGDLAFYKYGGTIYVCAVVGTPKVFDAIPAEVVSPEIVRLFEQ